MAHRITNRVRIIAAELDESNQKMRPRRNYRALLQRAKAYRTLLVDTEQADADTDDAPASDNSDSAPGWPPSPAPDTLDASHDERRTHASTHRPNAAHETLVSTTAYVEALTDHHERSVRAIEWLAARIGDFCTDPAIVASGVWSTRIQLDPSVLPFCTLELMFSHFQVALRFDADDPSSKQLILNNRELLQARLAAIFVRLGLHRTIEISV